MNAEPIPTQQNFKSSLNDAKDNERMMRSNSDTIKNVPSTMTSSSNDIESLPDGFFDNKLLNSRVISTLIYQHLYS